MKKMIALIALILLCITIASCTGKNESSSGGTAQLFPDESHTAENVEHGYATPVTEEPGGSDQQKVGNEETVTHETDNMEPDEPTNREQYVDPTEDDSIPESTIVDNSALEPNAEYGSPGIDD